MTFLRYFFYVLGAALLAALVGALFASALGLLSPEFVKGLFSPPEGTSLPRYAAAVGALWGLFLGAAAMGFCLALVPLVRIARLLVKKKTDDNNNTAS